MHIAHVSTFPPLRCGIASFASDMIGAVPDAVHSTYSLHYGENRVTEAMSSADVRSTQDLARLSAAISSSNCDVVSLQHEFGIWGGGEGEHIHAFLDKLSKPLVSVLHTTFGPYVRSAVQNDILQRLIDRSARVVVLTEMAKGSLELLLGRCLDKIVVIPHGVPDVSFAPAPDAWGDDRSGPPCRLITPGFFRESKGFETILLALRQLSAAGRPVHYTIAGEPQVQFAGQQGYREDLQSLIRSLGLESIVELDVRYLTTEEQINLIRGSHAGIFAYQDPAQSSSGTVPLVLAVGRPAICTPFEYAKAKAREGLAVHIAEDFGVRAVVRSIEALLDGRGYAEAVERTYLSTREWVWRRVGVMIREEYQRAVSMCPTS